MRKAEKRGAPSRRRKTAYHITGIKFLWLTSDILSREISTGVIKYFQKGMRNANGTPRRPKYMINLSKAQFIKID